MRYFRLGFILVALLSLMIVGMRLAKQMRPTTRAAKPTGAISAEKPSRDLYLEGISHEPEKPTDSVAVINGVFLREGDEYRDYRISKISASAVKMINLKDKSERELLITGGRSIAVVNPDGVLESADGSPTQPTQPAAGGLNGMLQQFLGASGEPGSSEGPKINPLAMLGQASNLATIADLRSVHTAATAYYYEEGYGQEITMAALEKSGMLPGNFKGGVKRNYRYTIEVIGDGVGVHADPLSGGSNATHFFVNEDGTIFAEGGRKATAASQEYGF